MNQTYLGPKRNIDQARLDEFDRDKPRPFSLVELVNHIIFLQGAKVTNGRLVQQAPGEFAKNFNLFWTKLECSVETLVSNS